MRNGWACASVPWQGPGVTVPLDGVSLTTGHLLLRPPEPRDEPEVLAACSDPDVARWTTVPSPYDEQDARTWVSEVVPQGWAGGTTATFVALHATTARLVGAVSLMGIGGGSAELGFWTAPHARGQGLTAEAVAATCRWGFAGLGLSRVLWQAEVGNTGSRAVAESCGFTVEGTLRQGLPTRGGGRCDSWTGALLAADEVRDRRAFGGRWTDLPGDGLVLRQWRDDDVDALVAGLSDAESARWLDVPVPYTPDDARAFLVSTQRRWADGEVARLAVDVGGVARGLVVGVPAPHDPAVVEVGWWVVPDARGSGLAVRAVEALVPWLAGLGALRLEAGVDVANTASQRVAEHAGFQREGVRRAGLRPLRGAPRRDGLLYARVLPG